MVLRTSRTNSSNGEVMSSATAIARSLERQERGRTGSVQRARQSLASKLRIGIGTFENIVRGRVKRIDAAIRDRLQALLVQELEREIMRLSHELEIARQSGAHLASEQVGEIETHLAAARSILAAPSTARTNLEGLR